MKLTNVEQVNLVFMGCPHRSIPVEPTPTIPTRQPFLPDPDDLIGVPAQSFDVVEPFIQHVVLTAFLQVALPIPHQNP